MLLIDSSQGLHPFRLFLVWTYDLDRLLKVHSGLSIRLLPAFVRWVARLLIPHSHPTRLQLTLLRWRCVHRSMVLGVLLGQWKVRHLLINGLMHQRSEHSNLLLMLYVHRLNLIVQQLHVLIPLLLNQRALLHQCRHSCLILCNLSLQSLLVPLSTLPKHRCLLLPLSLSQSVHHICFSQLVQALTL
jgi:hypothetical protein